jgi:hypothetical protein
MEQSMSEHQPNQPTKAGRRNIDKYYGFAILILIVAAFAGVISEYAAPLAWILCVALGCAASFNVSAAYDRGRRDALQARTDGGHEDRS